MRAQFEVNTLGPLRVVQALQGQLAPWKNRHCNDRIRSIDDNTSEVHMAINVEMRRIWQRSPCPLISLNKVASRVSSRLCQNRHDTGKGLYISRRGCWDAGDPVQPFEYGDHGFIFSREW